jgi:hypothetical protein
MVTEFEVSGLLPANIAQPVPLTTRRLAQSVDQHLAALWRGDEDVDHAFFRWLASWWEATDSTRPALQPDAVSVLGAGGVGIHWYQTTTEILGYVPGREDGCYRVPITSSPPNPETVWSTADRAQI